jgi:hypothetical protein
MEMIAFIGMAIAWIWSGLFLLAILLGVLHLLGIEFHFFAIGQVRPLHHPNNYDFEENNPKLENHDENT